MYSFLFVSVKNARRDTIAQRHFCTKGKFCTGYKTDVVYLLLLLNSFFLFFLLLFPLTLTLGR